MKLTIPYNKHYKDVLKLKIGPYLEVHIPVEEVKKKNNSSYPLHI